MPLGDYDHLSEDDPPNFTRSFDEIATIVVGMNYGMHRLLSALVRAYRANKKYPNRIIDEIEKLLNNGEH